MIRIEYVHDNNNSRKVFERLVYGLKDIDNSYIQPGMPDTLMFDKRMSVVPYKEQGAIFKIISKDNPDERIYFITLNMVSGRFKVNETFAITDTVNYTLPKVFGTIVASNIDSLGIKLTSATELTDAYLNFTIRGNISSATATIKNQSRGMSKYHPHTLTVVPTDVGHPTAEILYKKHFTPTKDITYLSGVQLSKGWNYVSIENDTTKENYVLIINCRYYATVMQSIADEIYKWVSTPIDKELANIKHYLSTRLCEMYPNFQELLPNVDTVQKLGMVLSIKSLVNFPGSTIATKELATALTGNTPVILPQEVNHNFLPAIWSMYNQAQDYSGVNMKVWIKNQQILRRLTFLQYVNNVPFYDLNSVSENEVSIVKTFPFFSYYVPIQIKSLCSCNNCGFWSWTVFTTCPSCGEQRTKLIPLDFKIGETVTFQNGATAVIVNINYKGLVVTNLDKQVTETETLIVGNDSKAQAIIEDIPQEYHDWNTPVFEALQNKRKLEWHSFNFSDEPFNDQWRSQNCLANLLGRVNISTKTPMNICAGFYPWDFYITNLLSFEPTRLEEPWFRTHQLDIDLFWDEESGLIHTSGNSSSSSSSSDYRDIIYSRYSDYSYLHKSPSLLYSYRYKGEGTCTVFKSLLDMNSITIQIPTGSICKSPYNVTLRNYANIPMIAIIYKNTFGYIPYVESDWELITTESINRNKGWATTLSTDPNTYLLDITKCSGFNASIIDQIVEWTYIPSYMTDIVKLSEPVVPIPDAPIASFDGTPLEGDAPLSVAFTNRSIGEITDYLWNFGDGTTSSARNPSHTYNNSGDYTVSLTVTGPGGTHSRTRVAYVHVNEEVYWQDTCDDIEPLWQDTCDNVDTNYQDRTE